MYDNKNSKINKNNQYNCIVTRDLLINCALKSKKLNECYILKNIYYKYCDKKNINYNSNK